MARVSKTRRIPDDVMRAAKAAGFKKPDIYSGRLQSQPAGAPRDGLAFLVVVLVAALAALVVLLAMGVL